MLRSRSAGTRRTGQDVCVVAGDGADRLGVIAKRVEWRVAQGVAPEETLVLAATERAAAELRFRLAPALAARVYSVSSFCERLLVEHAVEAGIDPRFRALDAAEAHALLLQAAEEALDEWLEEEPERAAATLAAVDFADPPGDMAAALEAMRLSAPEVRPGAPRRTDAAVSELLRALRRLAGEKPRDWSHVQKHELSELQAWAARMVEQAAEPASKEHFRLLSELRVEVDALPKGEPAAETAREVVQVLAPAARQVWAAEFYAPQRARLFDALERIDRRYRERLKERNALDPAGLLEKAVALLRGDAGVRSRVNRRLAELDVEGLEDLNPLEAALVQLVRPPSGVFAAGDPNEAVAGFPFVGPEAFRRFRESLGSGRRRASALRDDRRARGEILRAREAIVAGAPGLEPRALAASRSFARKAAPSVETIAAAAEDAEAAFELEARLVAQRIVELNGALEIHDGGPGRTRPARFSDIAVTVAAAAALEPFERALDAAGVPRAGAEEMRAAAELHRLLQVIRNPRDEISLAAALRSRYVGVSHDALLALKQYGNLGIALGWLENVDRERLGEDDLERLHTFRARLAEWRSLAGDVDRLAAALVAAGYSARVMARACAGGAVSLERLIDRVRRLRDRETGWAADGVRLLTMRQVKGLRFPIVFVAGLGENREAEPPALGYSPDLGLAVRWIDPAMGRPLADAAYATFQEDWRRARTERENRLLWLALGFAEEHLVLSFGAPGGEPRRWAERVVTALGEAAGDPERALPVRVRVENRVERCVVDEAPCAVENTPGLPPFGGQHDAIVSVRAIRVFADCPRRYYLEEYAPWQQPRSPAPEADVRAAPPSALDDNVAEAGRVERDLDFALDVEGVTVQGRIDLWFEREGRVTIVAVDLEDVSGEQAADRASQTALRLSLEALALERLAGKAPHEALVFFPQSGALEPVRLDAAAAVESVRELAAAQAGARFPLKPDARCWACPFYRGACPCSYAS